MAWFPGDDIFASARPRGLPIGNLTSQFLGNVFLDGFDHFVKRHLCCQAYLRYVDDFLLFADDKKTLWSWKTEIEACLAGLRLIIHPGAHPRPVSEGFPFLGFLVFPQKRRIKPRKGIYYQRKLHRLFALYAVGRLSFDRLSARVQGWANHARYGNTVGLRKAILGSMTIMPFRRRQTCHSISISGKQEPQDS